MTWRATTVSLVVGGAFADRAGDHRLAFYALLAAVPAGAIAALERVTERVERTVPLTQPLLWGAVLVLVVLGAAARSPVVVQGSVPTAARSALLACLAVFCLLAAEALRLELRERALERQRVRGVLRHLDHGLGDDERGDRHAERGDDRRVQQALSRR